MSFDTLLWIAIIVVYVLAFVLKRVFAALKTDKTESPKGPPPWKEKLDRLVTQVRKELEQKDSNRESEWAKVSPREDDEIELSVTDTQAVDIPLEPVKEAVTPEKSEYVPEKPAFLGVKTAVKEKERTVTGKKRRPDAIAWGVQDLKKAVVWAEILAPPLALRDRDY